MYWRIKQSNEYLGRACLKLTLPLLVVSLLSCGQRGNEISSTSEPYYNPRALIEVGELAGSLESEHLKLIDFRAPEDYRQGHLKGALNIWRNHLEDSDSEVPGLLLPRAELQGLLSGLGIRSSDTLLVYDGRAGCDAARLWWALKKYGFSNVRILNGGIKAWNDAGGLLTIETPDILPSDFVWPEAERPELLISPDTLLSLLGNPRVIIVDVRSEKEYSGAQKREGIGNTGHIPGSIHLDWSRAVNLEGDHRFQNFSGLSNTYATFVQSAENTVVTYCHSGVRSAHTLFVLHELLGHQNVRNFDGSWLLWSNWEEAPFENDIMLVN